MIQLLESLSDQLAKHEVAEALLGHWKKKMISGCRISKAILEQLMREKLRLKAHTTLDEVSKGQRSRPVPVRSFVLQQLEYTTLTRYT